MITLPHLSAIHLDGPDAVEFLHNQLSADVSALADSETTWACYCEPKGRVLALMLVARIDSGFYIIMSRSLAQTVADRLKIYVMRSRVEITLLEDKTVTGQLTGKQGDEAIEASNKFTHVIPVPGGGRWLAVADTDSAPTVNEGLLASWHYSELQDGICWLNDKSSGHFLPQMLGHDTLGAVNFKKGCYPGQEIVARTHYLGKIKRHPRVLNVGKVPALELMKKIHLQANGMSDEAVLVDSAGNDQLGYCLLVVSRIAPDLVVDQIGFENERTSSSV